MNTQTKQHLKKHQSKYTMVGVALGIVASLSVIDTYLGKDTDCGRCVDTVFKLLTTDAGVPDANP